uniref:Cystatin-B n=1 Tax=Monopterus albus TaxID=43700 RepID=A0A3Q3KAY3_MONAL
MLHMCGGLSPADKKIQEICDSVKHQAEKKSGKNYAHFKADSYATQTVAGTNYIIKVQVNGNEYVHLHVFEGLQCNGGHLELKSMQGSKTKQDPIVLF